LLDTILPVALREQKDLSEKYSTMRKKRRSLPFGTDAIAMLFTVLLIVCIVFIGDLFVLVLVTIKL
jgi:hypothetical protein